MSSKIVCLFDVDGTLTKPRNPISNNFLRYLLEFASKIPVAVVSGSDYPKLVTQLGGESAIRQLPFVFSENGLVVYSFGKLVHKTGLVEQIGEELLQDLINFSLLYMSKLRLPKKRGTFIEFRNGLVNISPVGRSCSQEERDEFAKYDETHHIRQKFVSALSDRFGLSPLQFAIGGQISIDVFPVGWDKRYCLQFLNDYSTIHFFGDKTTEGGNDYEIFEDPRTVGHMVVSPEDTESQLRALFPE